MLELRDVHTYYGDSHVLHGVSLRVGAGEVVGLLGRNGVGKTTTLRSIMGLTPPRSGEVLLDGRPIRGLPAHAVARLGLGYVPESRRIFPNLTVEENLLLARLAGPARGDGRPVVAWDLQRVYEVFPRLAERRRQWGGSLSGGEQQMLAIGRALMTQPRLLLLDEPSQGLAPAIVRLVTETIAGIARAGVSILLVEQNVRMAMKLVHRVYVLSKGRVVYEGMAGELDANPDLKRLYLGI